MKAKYVLAALLLPGFVWAQAPEKNKEVEQIVITKKGQASEKLNIVVDGDHVTVNGKPLDKSDKEAEITVTRRKIKDLDVWVDDGLPGERRFRTFTRPQAAIAPNKAMLGVVTSKTEEGVKVMNVSKGSAAEIAGIKEGDLITQVDQKKIETPDALSNAISDKNPGDKVTITYIRDNKTQTVSADLKKWEAPEIPALREFEFRTLPGFNLDEFRGRRGDIENELGNRQFRAFSIPANRAKLGVKVQDMETGLGVKVIEVETGSDAAKAGIKAGDVIKEVNGKTISGTDDIRLSMAQAAPGNNISMKLDRNGKSQHLDVQLSKKIKTAEL